MLPFLGLAPASRRPVFCLGNWPASLGLAGRFAPLFQDPCYSSPAWAGCWHWPGRTQDRWLSFRSPSNRRRPLCSLPSSLDCLWSLRVFLVFSDRPSDRRLDRPSGRLYSAYLPYLVFVDLAESCFRLCLGRHSGSCRADSPSFRPSCHSLDSCLPRTCPNPGTLPWAGHPCCRSPFPPWDFGC